MRVINFYGGAGCGKSTTAAGLFYLMKINGYNVELVQEYVKDLAWEDRMEDQAFITAQQNKKLERLKNKVDYVICDSSLILSLAYITDDYPVPSFRTYVTDLFHHYDNFLHVYVNRVAPYVKAGRYQDEAGAKEFDKKILKLMQDLKLETHFVDGNIDAPDKILKIIEGKIENAH